MSTNETHASVTGAAPSLIRALRQAAELATERGRGWFGVEDVLSVLLSERRSVLGHHASEQGLTREFESIRDLARSIVPGTTAGTSTPVGPATVEATVTGPDADELIAAIQS
ncbi:hypothetical protein [Nocardia sp. alder85J]|uniref:hypothetical protein n=1 Tax=Nocardia sp. alder85J TaxID=2862949 RepID=UPI001CD79D43|nr:hypothetical protein [Nocardia sp. alder85J]MCX4097140.1 hypothetical protein [Nocardia sp. alder85J]